MVQLTTVDCENFIPQKGPSTQLIDATSCIKVSDAMIVVEELIYILSYQTLSTDKHSKSYKSWTKLIKNDGAYVRH